jgi:hypothetical protein
MRTYTDSIEILEMIKGKARPGVFLVVDCFTKLLGAIILRAGRRSGKFGPQWRPLPESWLHLRIDNFQI